MAKLWREGFQEAALSECRDPAWALLCWENPGLGLVDWATVESARSVR